MFRIVSVWSRFHGNPKACLTLNAALLDNCSMETTLLGKIILGGYFILVGLIMIIFHKQLKDMKDEWVERFPAVFWRAAWKGPTGLPLTVVIITLGVICIFVGVLLIGFIQD